MRKGKKTKDREKETEGEKLRRRKDVKMIRENKQWREGEGEEGREGGEGEEGKGMKG